MSKNLYETLLKSVPLNKEYIEEQITKQFHTGTIHLLVPETFYSFFIDVDTMNKIKKSYVPTIFSSKEKYIKKSVTDLLLVNIKDYVIKNFGFPQDIHISKLSVYDVNIFTINNYYYESC